MSGALTPLPHRLSRLTQGLIVFQTARNCPKNIRSLTGDTVAIFDIPCSSLRQRCHTVRAVRLLLSSYKESEEITVLLSVPTFQRFCLSVVMVEASWNVMAHAQKPEFVFRAKRTSPFKSAVASFQSTAGSRGVRIGGSNAGYTMFWGSVKSTGYPLRSPVSPSFHRPVRYRVPSHSNWSLWHGVSQPGDLQYWRGFSGTAQNLLIWTLRFS